MATSRETGLEQSSFACPPTPCLGWFAPGKFRRVLDSFFFVCFVLFLTKFRPHNCLNVSVKGDCEMCGDGCLHDNCPKSFPGLKVSFLYLTLFLSVLGPVPSWICLEFSFCFDRLILCPILHSMYFLRRRHSWLSLSRLK